MQACFCSCTGVVDTSLGSSRKQVTAGSCKTCGGRPPVDGIGSISASMISAKGLELTNFINPDLTWKTVSKGYRSSTRRSRKPIERSPKSESDVQDKGESPSDTIVSESEKLGVAVLGQRFSDKVEHVPIKKRRFTVRSPSPPSCFNSPHMKDYEKLVRGPYPSERSCPKSISKRQPISMDASKRRRNVNHYYTEDFSGIEILAAAACNNNVGDDVNHAQDNLMVEKSSKEGREKLNQVDRVIGGAKEGLVSLGEKEGFVFRGKADENHNGADDKNNDAADEKTAGSVCLRDVRLHWDLNVEMDAWEQPLDTTMDSQTNAVEDVPIEKQQVFDACEFQKESTDIKNDIATPAQPIIEDNQKLELETGIGRNEDECIPTVKGRESSISSDIAAETSQNTGDMFTGHSHCPGSDNIKAGVFSEGTKKTSSTDINVKQVAKDLALGAQPSMEEKLEGAAFEVESILLNEDGNKSATASSLPGNVKPLGEMIGSNNTQAPVPVSKAEGGSGGHSEFGYEDTSASSAPIEAGQPMVVANAEKQGGEASLAHTCDSTEQVHDSAGNSKSNLGAELGTAAHEVYQKCGDSSADSLARTATETAIEDTCDDSHILDVCDNDQSGEKGNTRDIDAGYDSQYEDGELRESDVPYWEDDCEEAECVDYGSDTYDDVADYSMASKYGVQVECSEEEFCGSETRSIDRNMKVERVLGPGSDNLCERVEHGVAGDGSRQQPVGSKFFTSGSDELAGGSKISPSRTAEAPAGGITRRLITDCLDGFGGKDSPAKPVGSGVARKELAGTVDLLSSGTLHRNDFVFVQRGRSGNFDLCAQPEEARNDHSIGKERSNFQLRCKSPGGVANPSVSYWSSRRRESPTYHGSFGSDRPRPRSIIESRRYATTHSEAGGVAADNYGHRQAINSFSNGSYRQPFRRRSPINRDGVHNTHRGMVPLRDSSPDRRRFRRYPQGVGRGFREEYQRPLPHNDSDQYPHHVPNRIIRRDQNSSPPPRGPVYYRRPYKRSQSRSSSRSPGPWFVSREQEVVKHRSSRSPDYRFEARMERMRVPFQKQNFGAKYEVGFLSPQRRRFSPQHNNSRWLDDQNGAPDHQFRGRRYPARTFQQGQRFDSVGSSRRLNSDDYFEPAMRPARFSEMGRGGGRPRRYDGSDDERRKNDGRYEIFPRVKRYDSDGVVRRFHFDEEDSFVSRNIHNNYNDSDNNNGAERRPRNVYMGELVKRKAN